MHSLRAQVFCFRRLRLLGCKALGQGGKALVVVRIDSLVVPVDCSYGIRLQASGSKRKLILMIVS